MSEGKQEARETSRIGAEPQGWLWQIAKKHRKIVAGYEFADWFNWQEIQREIESLQANQPQGKAQPESGEMGQDLEVYHGPQGKLLKLNKKGIEQAAFQRGQQAGLEKAAQAMCWWCKEGSPVVECNEVITANGRPFWHKDEGGTYHICDAAPIRSLASAEPPQGEAEKEVQS